MRFDIKRQKVWMWTGKGPIEMDWSNMVPRIESSVASAYATVKIYRGQFAELGLDGQPLKTRGIPHVIQCGQASAAEEGVKPSMEFVRLYMERGITALPQVEKLLKHRPKWWAMVNLIGMGDAWVAWKANRDKPGLSPAPITSTVVMIVLFPILFPLQFTNWVALRFAPIPKWPKDVEALHEKELAELAARAAQPRRRPVIRLNGELVSGGDGEGV
ncbi:hypothetical protein AX767_16180 [Variovorax sp. PAMC 28711]|nr:hypothetical protein AX767_16180 [Variovorax sp. PAMC 28711]